MNNNKIGKNISARTTTTLELSHVTRGVIQPIIQPCSCEKIANISTSNLSPKIWTSLIEGNMQEARTNNK